MLSLPAEWGMKGLAAGGALGGLAGGALGQIGGVLSAPRRFLWHDVLGGPENGNELVSNMTGLDKDGLAAQILGMGAEVAGDPLTYATAGLGGGLGASVGGELGEAAMARGPQFPGGIKKLWDVSQELKAMQAAGTVKPDVAMRGHNLINILKSHPEAMNIMKEVPPESKFLGAGVEGLALKTPQGDTLRLGTGLHSPENPYPLLRPAAPEMVQPTRAVRFAGEAPDIEKGRNMTWGVSAERVPLADKTYPTPSPRVPPDPEAMGFVPGMRERAQAQGFPVVDLHPGNIAQFGDKTMMLDPGTIDWPAGYLPDERMMPPPSSGGLTDRLLNMMGADSAVQRKLGQAAKLPARGGVIPKNMPRTTNYSSLPTTPQLGGSS